MAELLVWIVGVSDEIEYENFKFDRSRSYLIIIQIIFHLVLKTR